MGLFLPQSRGNERQITRSPWTGTGRGLWVTTASTWAATEIARVLEWRQSAHRRRETRGRKLAVHPKFLRLQIWNIQNIWMRSWKKYYKPDVFVCAGFALTRQWFVRIFETITPSNSLKWNWVVSSKSKLPILFVRSLCLKNLCLLFTVFHTNIP